MISKFLKNAPRTQLLVFGFLATALFISSFSPTFAGSGAFVKPTISLPDPSKYIVATEGPVRIPVTLTIGDNISDPSFACQYSSKLGQPDLAQTSIAPFSSVEAATDAAITHIDWNQNVPTVLQTSSSYTLYVGIAPSASHELKQGSLFCSMRYWIGTKQEYIETPVVNLSLTGASDSYQGS